MKEKIKKINENVWLYGTEVLYLQMNGTQIATVRERSFPVLIPFPLPFIYINKV